MIDYWIIPRAYIDWVNCLYSSGPTLILCYRNYAWQGRQESLERTMDVDTGIWTVLLRVQVLRSQDVETMMNIYVILQEPGFIRCHPRWLRTISHYYFTRPGLVYHCLSVVLIHGLVTFNSQYSIPGTYEAHG